MPAKHLLQVQLMTLAIVTVMAAAPIFGQTFYGSVVGNVRDASGAAMASVPLTLTNNGTGERRTTSTGADGGYRFVNIVPGNYRIGVEQSGFKRYSRDQIVVNVDAAVRVDVLMQVGEVTQVVEVQASVPLLQTESGALSQVVEGRSVQELPLNGRNVLNLVQL